jgi:hypothetical protein
LSKVEVFRSARVMAAEHQADIDRPGHRKRRTGRFSGETLRILGLVLQRLPRRRLFARPHPLVQSDSDVTIRDHAAATSGSSFGRRGSQ